MYYSTICNDGDSDCAPKGQIIRLIIGASVYEPAAAIRAEADVIVTFNLVDFPPEAVANDDIEA